MMDNEKRGGGTRDLPRTAPHILAANPALSGGYARAYSVLELSVIRIHGVREGSCACGNDCGKDAGKHPDVGGSWKPYTNTPARPELLGRWFREAPSANVAIICGAVSGVIVVDADGEAGVAELGRRGLAAT